MPTILELTDLPLPKTLQGSSLIPLGSGDAKGWRTMTVTENGDGSGASRGIRTDRYKLILRVRAKEGVPGVYELYDLQKDPGEKTNLFAKDQAKTIGPILDQFEAWAKQTEDSVGLEMAGKCRKTLE
jgi:arylsulfatase A-like enzyme